MNRIMYGFFAFAFLSMIMYYITGDGNKYVSSLTGTVCYIIGHEPKTIKKKVFHKTLDKCESYIINFQ